MIIVLFHSQLGNQLFQYAFAKSAAKLLKTIYIPYLDVDSTYQLHCFKTDWFTDFVYSNPWRTRQLKRFVRLLVKLAAPDLIEDKNGQVPPVLLKNNTCYEGYFQSDWYFKDNFAILKRAFTIKKKHREEFITRYASLFQHHKVVVIHIRRADYQYVEIEGLGGCDLTLPMEYYRSALSQLNDLHHYKLMVVGDDVDSVQEAFSGFPNISFEHNTPIIDFQLIQHADVAIIANSTFAWWAAYLSKNDNSKILAPYYWLGHKVNRVYPGGITTDRFNWIYF